MTAPARLGRLLSAGSGSGTSCLVVTWRRHGAAAGRGRGPRLQLRGAGAAGSVGRGGSGRCYGGRWGPAGEAASPGVVPRPSHVCIGCNVESCAHRSLRPAPFPRVDMSVHRHSRMTGLRPQSDDSVSDRVWLCGTFSSVALSAALARTDVYTVGRLQPRETVALVCQINTSFRES